jgi:hypothetical protein
VTEILTERVSAPNVWRGDEFADTRRWIIPFTEEDFADFERAQRLPDGPTFLIMTIRALAALRCRSGI